MSARERLERICGPQAPPELIATLDAYRAEVLAADGQAYDGQLAMLTGLVATLRAVATHGDLADVRKLLDEHQRDEQDAYTETEKSSPTGADATPDFFQPGHSYTREHHGDTILFLVEHVSTSPDGSHRAAHGWRTRSWDPGWEPTDSDDRTGWTDVTEAVAQ